MTMNVGVIGCGNISGAYLTAARKFPEQIKITACADLSADAAQAKATEFGLRATTVEDLLADPSIGLVLNLTHPAAHAELNLRALAAGKHVHVEKPFALSLDDANAVLKLAKRRKLLTGSAPDTFLGGGHQTCRALVDAGEIGRPVAGTAFMMCPGHESWHPNPGFYYLTGGGPTLDMGPYYVTALVNLLGPVARVCGVVGAAHQERVATTPSIAGRRLPVEIPTHQAGTLEFANGAIVSLVMSFDVQAHLHSCIEVYGTAGSLHVPDPNCFGGPVRIRKAGEKEWTEAPIRHGYTDNCRSIGAADLAAAATHRRPARCSGELARHVLEVMLAIAQSSDTGRHVKIKSAVERPAALPVGLPEGALGD
jgi:predicted dehydrogenase